MEVQFLHLTSKSGKCSIVPDNQHAYPSCARKAPQAWWHLATRSVFECRWRASWTTRCYAPSSRPFLSKDQEECYKGMNFHPWNWSFTQHLIENLKDQAKYCKSEHSENTKRPTKKKRPTTTLIRICQEKEKPNSNTSSQQMTCLWCCLLGIGIILKKTTILVTEFSGVSSDGDEAKTMSQHFVLDQTRVLVQLEAVYGHCRNLKQKKNYVLYYTRRLPAPPGMWGVGNRVSDSKQQKLLKNEEKTELHYNRPKYLTKTRTDQNKG